MDDIDNQCLGNLCLFEELLFYLPSWTDCYLMSIIERLVVLFAFCVLHILSVCDQNLKYVRHIDYFKIKKKLTFYPGATINLGSLINSTR